MLREEYRAMLRSLSDADLLHETAVRIRQYLDYQRDRGLCVEKDLCWEECLKRGGGIWDEAVTLAKKAGRHDMRGELKKLKGGE